MRSPGRRVVRRRRVGFHRARSNEAACPRWNTPKQVSADGENRADHLATESTNLQPPHSEHTSWAAAARPPRGARAGGARTE